jgi:DNA-binding GntR family transcriptional regulator
MPPTPAPTLNGNLSRRGRRSIERRSLHRDVADQIRDMIVEGELPPGERVNEGALSEQFGISRTPLREALKVLASEGLVELRPNRGTRVSAITPEEVGELFEAVSGIERMAGELAALRMTERDIERLKALHERMERHYEAGERHEYFRLNQQIHNTIVSLAGNSILEATHASLMVRVRRARYMAIQSPERWHESVQEHRAIMQALEARDSAGAGDLILNHVRRTGEVVKQSFVASGPARTDH